MKKKPDFPHLSKLTNITIVVLLSILYGCSSITPINQMPHHSKVIHQLIDSSENVRPQWIDSPPANTEKELYFIGVSTLKRNEANAKTDARQYATKSLAEYMGTSVSEVKHFTHKVSNSGKTEHLDSAQVSSQVVNSKVGNLRVQKWYWEKFVTINGNIPKTYYQYWGLITVAKDDYEELVLQNRDEITRQRSQLITNKKHQSIVGLLKQGDLLSAINLINQEKRNLREIKHHLGSAEYSSFELANELEKISGILADVKLKISSSHNKGDIYYVTRNESEISLFISYSYQSIDYPLSNIALNFADSSGNTIDRATTSATGSVMFTAKELFSGSYRISLISVFDESDNQLSTTKKAANNIYTDLKIAFPKNNIHGAVKLGLFRLFQNNTQLPSEKLRISITSIVDERTKLGGVLAKKIEQELALQIPKLHNISFMLPTKRTRTTVNQFAKHKGVKISRKPLSLGVAAIQAKLNGADVALKLSYQIGNKAIELSFYLIDADTNQLLAASRSTIKLKYATGLIDVTPLTNRPFFSTAAPKPKDIAIEITSHLGDGQTYEQGDDISYYVSTDQDAYLLLIYEDANGGLTQIIPNKNSIRWKYKADIYFEVPDKQALFTFRITEPFGTETVWAFAATRPFPLLDGVWLENGLLRLNYARPEEILKTLRDFGKLARINYGEARTQITTIQAIE